MLCVQGGVSRINVNWDELVLFAVCGYHVYQNLRTEFRLGIQNKWVLGCLE